MIREEPNKRSADDWPTFESKKTCTGHVNMLKAGKDPNQFMMTCLQDASKDIMKHVTKEAEKVKEFKALDVKQKVLVLKRISDMIFTRCYDVMLNKIVCGEKHTTMLYYKTYPKEKGLDDEIMRMLLETPKNLSLNKIDSIGSACNCPTSESSSDKIVSKGTSNCPTSESSSDKIVSKGTSNCPASEPSSEKIVPNSINMQIPESDLSSFELTCIQESVRDIIEHINQEALKMNEFNSLEEKQKNLVLKKVSDVIFTRCKFFMKNKVIDSHTRITKIYFTKFPKYKGLDQEIHKMIKEAPNPLSLYEFVDFEVLPQAEQINTIFCDKIDTSVEECFKKMIINIKNYENDKDILQCIDELPSIEDIKDESDKLDNSVDSTAGNDIESTVKSDTIVLADLNEVIDDYEPERKKLKEYYKIIDWFLVPKIENLLESYKSEFREILKNDKEYSLEQTKLRDEFVKLLKAKKKSRNERRCLIECKLEANENDSDDKEMNSEIDDRSVEMNSQNTDMDDGTNSQNTDMDEEMNSQNDDMVEEINLQSADMVEEMNSENNDIMDEDNSENKDSKGHDNDKNEDEKGKSNVMTIPDPLYRVKLISMPYLPAKELILQFLNQFNTKAIKKHKTLKNLLVIDLKTEHDYNNILKACGTKIGRHKLLIKMNEANDSDVKEVNKNVGIQADRNNSGNIPEIVKVFKQDRDDKTSDETDENSEVRKHVVRQEPNVERDMNSETRDIVIKLEPKDEPTDVRTTNVEKAADVEVDEKIEKNEKVPSMPQEVDVNNSQFVAKLCASPCLPKKEKLSYFLKKYNPTAIKMHKKFRHILLITFNNKNDYENFLSMDGYRINFTEITIVKVPQIKKSCKKPNVANEETDVKGSKVKHVSNDETIEGFKMNNEKVLNSQTSVDVDAINTIDKEKCPKETTNDKLEFFTAATVEHEIKNTSNDNTSNECTAFNNNTKVVNCQKTVASTTNIIDEDMTCPKETTNNKTEQASIETVIDIKKEHIFNKDSGNETLGERSKMNVDTRVLDEQNETDTKEHDVNIKDKEIESNTNSEAKTDDVYTHFDNIIIKTEQIDNYENIKSEPDFDCNVINVKKEDVLKIKQEITEVSDELIVKESNIQLGLKNLKMEIEEDDTNIVVNDQNVESEQDIFLTSEKFHPTLKIDSSDHQTDSDQTGDIMLCENELKEHLDANLKEIVIKKITETFSKIEKINKETNFELLNCKKLEDETVSEHSKELIVKTEVNSTKDKRETQIVEDTFFKKLNALKDNILTMLNEDEEYIIVKSSITENAKRLRK